MAMSRFRYGGSRELVAYDSVEEVRETTNGAA